MQGVHLRKYGVETIINFELYEVDGVDLRIDAADAGSDCTIRKDQGADATCENDFVDEGLGYSITLTATEMEAASITIYIVDSATKVWLDKVICIETYGHASAQHAFDLDTASVAQSADNETRLATIETDTGDTLDTLIKDIPTVAEFEARSDVAGTAATPAEVATALNTYDAPTKAEMDTAHALLATVAKQDVIDSIVDTILVDTNELQGLIASSKIAAQVKGMDANVLTASALKADAVDEIHDEVIEGTITHRQAMALILAVLTGKSSGGGTATLVFRDTGDTKNRLSCTVDANGNRTAVGTRDGS